MRASLCRCGNRMVQDCIRVDVHLDSTISTTYPFLQFSRGFGFAKMMSCEVSSGMSLPKAGHRALCAAEQFWMTNFMYSRELLWSCVGCWPDILQAYASEQCKFLLRRQNHVGNGPSVSGLVHPKQHRSGRSVRREAVNMPTDRKCRQVHSYLIITFLPQNNVCTSGFVVSILFFEVVTKKLYQLHW